MDGKGQGVLNGFGSDRKKEIYTKQVLRKVKYLKEIGWSRGFTILGRHAIGRYRQYMRIET